MADEYQPSEHRGPGAIINPDEAKTIRQQASQHETVAKKRKVVMTAQSTGAQAIVSALRNFGGEPLVQSTYNASRHRLSKKGKAISPCVTPYLADTYGPGGFMQYENNVLLIEPKFNIGPNQTVGTNFSPGMGYGKAFKQGHKVHFRGQLPQANAMNIANAGVNFRNSVIAELTMGNPPGSPPPTEDEIKAAMGLALYHAPVNATRPFLNRIPINKDGDN